MTRYHHGDLRRALLDAATRMLGAGQGVPSLRAVAREAGVSPGAPYHHFPDRRHLLAALAVEGFESLDEALTKACRRLTQPEAILVTSCGTYLKFAVAHAAHYRVMFSSDYADEEAFAEYHRVGRASFATLTEKVGAVRPELSATQVDALATSIWSMAHGMSTLYSDGPIAHRSLTRAAKDLGAHAVALVRGA